MANGTDQSSRRQGAEWREVVRAAWQRYRPLVRGVLLRTATDAWGRGALGVPWHLQEDPETASWRVYRYLGSDTSGVHYYLELGVSLVLDQEGRVQAFQVDNGTDFLALADISEAGLRRGLLHLLQREPRPKAYSTPVYQHPIRPFREITTRRGCLPWLSIVVRH